MAPRDRDPFLFKRRAVRLTALASIALALAAVKPNSSASDPFVLEGVGINSSAGLVDDPSVAQAEMAELDALGGRTIEISVPYTRGGADVKNDKIRICNDVNAALAAGDEIVIRDADHYQNGRLGFMPATAHDFQKLYTRDIALIETLVGPNGCAKDLKELYYSPLNEPDNHLFNNDQTEGPLHFVNLYLYLNHLLPKEALERGLNLRIMIGELAQRNALPFLKDVKQVMAEQDVTGSDMGSVDAVHYYFNGRDANVSTSADAYLRSVKQALNDTFGKMDTWLTEDGAISTIPSSMAQHYAPLPHSIKPVSPEQQGEDISNLMYLAAKNGIKRVLNFELQDDGSKLRTGLIYNNASTATNATHKASFSIVQRTVQQLVSQK